MELTSSKAPGRPASADLFFDQGWRAQISIRSPVFRYDLARGVDGAGAGAGASNFRSGSTSEVSDGHENVGFQG